ncbi:MAG: hypothetical protein IH843_06540 [Thaumarchaeota archaeon]|nr:hypothetical protein [Nitrososphaerota archaeon]
MKNFHIKIATLKNVMCILLYCVAFGAPSNVHAMEKRNSGEALEEIR